MAVLYTRCLRRLLFCAYLCCWFVGPGGLLFTPHTLPHYAHHTTLHRPPSPPLALPPHYRLHTRLPLPPRFTVVGCCHCWVDTVGFSSPVGHLRATGRYRARDYTLRPGSRGTVAVGYCIFRTVAALRHRARTPRRMLPHGSAAHAAFCLPVAFPHIPTRYALTVRTPAYAFALRSTFVVIGYLHWVVLLLHIHTFTHCSPGTHTRLPCERFPHTTQLYPTRTIPHCYTYTVVTTAPHAFPDPTPQPIYCSRFICCCYP